MKYTPVRRFLEGGPVDAPQETPMEEAPQQGGQDPIMMIAQMAAQALQNQDCDAAMQVCQAFIQLIQQSQGGAPAEAAPQGQPVYRKGGRLIKRI